MKITKLHIRNLFGLKEFSSTGKSIELSGKNGIGKTVVLDAIKLALTNRSSRECIITNGEKEGEVLIEMDDGLRIDRKFRTDKSNYKSIKQGSGKGELTEAFLREVFTELQLNPIEFASMSSKEQNRIILDLIEFDWNMDTIKGWFGEIPPDVNWEQNILSVLHDIQSEDGHYFRTRQDLNREVRNKRAFIEEIGATIPDGYKVEQWEKADLGAIYKEIERIRKDNEWIERAKRAVSERDNKVRGFQAEHEIERTAIDRETTTTRSSLEKQLRDMEERTRDCKRQLEELEDKRGQKLELARKTYEAAVAKFEGEVEQYEELAKKELTDFSELQEKAETTERMKSYVNEYKRMVDLQRDVEQLQEASERLTGKIEKARALPGEILDSADIPIPGLEIKDGMPLINGLPVSNLSEGETLELCVGVTVKRLGKGALNLILIDGVEKLATDKRNGLYAMLKDQGVNFVATRTADDEDLTVVEL